MFSIDVFISEVYKQISNGISSFVIYPYGSNGLKCKQLLKDYFGIEPRLIVDNKLCKVCHEIINDEQLYEQYNDGMCILLNVEDAVLNIEAVRRIRKNIIKVNVINLFDNEGFRAESFNKENLYFESVLPRKKINRKKIAIRIAVASITDWNIIESICAAINETDYDILLLVSDTSSMAISDLISKSGYPYCVIDEYDPSIDMPDIFLLFHPYDNLTGMYDIRRYTKRIVVVFSEIYNGLPLTYFEKQLLRNLEKYRPDKYIFDSYYYNYAKRITWLRDRSVNIGSPHYDRIYSTMRNKTIPDNYQKLNGKPVILWATDHGVGETFISQDVTFDIFAKWLVDYFDKTTGMGLIFRPHPTLLKELVRLNIWTENNIEELRDYCDRSPNIIFDTNVDFSMSFTVANAVVTDAFCGFAIMALSLDKPICLTARAEDMLPCDREVLDACTLALRTEELKDFIDDINNNIDKKKDIRNRLKEKYIKEFDGKNGHRIADFITKYLGLDV